MKNNSTYFSLLLTLLSALPLCAQTNDPAALKQSANPDGALLLACDNVTDPGLVCCDQTICLGDTTTALAETLAPSGGSGELEYGWLRLKIVPGEAPTWVTDPSSTEPSHPAFVPAETTYLMREVRRKGCISLLASNVITVTVLPAGDPACLASSTHSADVSPFSVFPNPVDASTRLRNGSQMPAEVFIEHLNGRVVSHFKMSGGAEKSIDGIGWPAGIYVVRSKTSDGKAYLNKLVKL